MSVFCSPGSPSLAKRGVCRVEVAKFMLPQPPRPPWAATKRWPSSDMSTSCSPVAWSMTSVPLGTLSTRSSAFLPLQSEPMPCWPARAIRCCWKRKSSSVVSCESAMKMTEPPLPPSPPDGPPFSMNFSRWNATAP